MKSFTNQENPNHTFYCPTGTTAGGKLEINENWRESNLTPPMAFFIQRKENQFPGISTSCFVFS